MEKRLISNEVLREKYITFMQDYELTGHMSVCDLHSEDYASGDRYVIPHHGIFKAESDKIRVVFDASCATTTGISLNDTLQAGRDITVGCNGDNLPVPIVGIRIHN